MQLLDTNSVILKPESVFWDVHGIILKKYKNIDPKKITMNAQFFKDLSLNEYDIIELINDLQKRYNRAIPTSVNAERAKTLGEFSRICACALNEKIPLSQTVKLDPDDVVKIATKILAEQNAILEKNIKPTSRLTYDFHFDSLSRMELMMELEKRLNISISDDIIYDKHDTLKDFCEKCIKHSVSKVNGKRSIIERMFQRQYARTK